MKHKVLIVDDHWVVREGMKLILGTDDNYDVVGEAEEGNAALEQMEALKPDVILMDLNMPGGLSGLDTLKIMNEKNIQIPVIILTTYNEDELMINGLRLGAKGYLLKDTSRENLFRTLESALRGETLLQPEITARVFAYRHKPAAEEKPKNALSLTEKELIILQAVARGLRSKDIAFDMGMAERTVKAQLTNIYNKLGVDSRSEAVAVSVERGILHL
ncbi:MULTISPECIES: response regulator transcription factor [unclassified Paenibacillus]|uniref:response regulator n=1 Tax=unclassified Paenibacillus TaxID=185978 RepID=UPI0008BDB63C|nr:MULTISPECIES: response regulator transcription factor [unclassified Paenibacillus]SEK60935.1 two component transcriptional regulator, LuxR family [Paenibacillus sp. OK003]SLK20936.1 two component transcriptional regulator, LuxR family [Paenibacillus sp. RU5A]SOC76381.1 two component transcriptional regulator, LuxR family [Paenibacillus sp. RU26A]SOC77928.1 two component transcriptional regulator, LuxR family [Paenibacillus sp. RU5M]